MDDASVGRSVDAGSGAFHSRKMRYVDDRGDERRAGARFDRTVVERNAPAFFRGRDALGWEFRLHFRDEARVRVQAHHVQRALATSRRARALEKRGRSSGGRRLLFPVRR